MLQTFLKDKSMLRNSNVLDREYFKKHELKKTRGLAAVPLEVVYLKDREYWNSSLSALFNGKHYLSKNPDLAGWKAAPVLHYIQYGYFEGRSPSALIDVDFIMNQIMDSDNLVDGDSRQFKFGVLKKYDGIFKLLEETGCNPNPLFDNEFFLKNISEDIGCEIPIVYYYRHKGINPKNNLPFETTPIISMRQYLESNPDLKEAKVNLLEHLLMYGLQEKRLCKFKKMVSEEFLKNTADLYSNPELLSHEKFVLESACSGRVAGPGWYSPFHHNAIPALKHQAENKYKIFIGIVLYKNSLEELSRLKLTIEKEKESIPQHDIEAKYFVNDVDNIQKYKEILNPKNIVISSEGNIGFGKAQNALMRICFESNDLYLGINPDGYFIPGCIGAAINFSDFYKGSALIELASMPVEHPKWYDPVTFDTKWVSGAAFLMPKNIWNEVGGFDEGIHMYCEDVDLSWRVKASGYSLKVCPSAKFFHDVTPRFIEEIDKDTKRRRDKEMFMGAYYLCRKWGAEQMASLFKEKLLNSDLISDHCELREPLEKVSTSVSSSIADFNHHLRFSPSRFW